MCLLFNFEYKLLCFYFCSYFASQLPTRCHSLNAQIQSIASGHVNCARALKLVIKRSMIFPEMTLIDRNNFIFIIHCNHSKKDDNNSHTCIRSYTSLPVYLVFCIAYFAAPEECVLYATFRGGTRFETATLIGLIAD